MASVLSFDPLRQSGTGGTISQWGTTGVFYRQRTLALARSAIDITLIICTVLRELERLRTA